MRILIAGDTHGHITHCAYVGYQAATYGCDAVFVVGDFGFWEHEPSGEDFLDDIAGLAEDQGVPWYAIDGNHDKTSLVLEYYGHAATDEGFLTVRPNVFYAPRGLRWTWGKARFIALGGAYSVDKQPRLAEEQHQAELRHKRNKYRPADRRRSTDYSGTVWFPEEEMTDEDMARFLTDTTPVDVILAHDKPRSSNPGWNRKDLPECWPNQDRLDLAMKTLQPQLYVHGHLHHRYTQSVRSGDDGWCLVEGLDCNRAAKPVLADHPYRAQDSWGVLDTELPDLYLETN